MRHSRRERGNREGRVWIAAMLDKVGVNGGDKGGAKSTRSCDICTAYRVVRRVPLEVLDQPVCPCWLGSHEAPATEPRHVSSIPVPAQPLHIIPRAEALHDILRDGREGQREG
eukprot:583183-Rhodomonas_salina.1